MLCLNCREFDPKALQGLVPVESDAACGRASARRQRRCERCGSVLIGPDSAEAMVRKLNQLENFGLAGRAKSVLEPKRPSTSGSTPEE
jgi:hypothetical protein